MSKSILRLPGGPAGSGPARLDLLKDGWERARRIPTPSDSRSGGNPREGGGE